MNTHTKFALSLTIAMATMASCSKKQEKAPEPTPEISVATVTTDSVTTFREYPGYLTADKYVDIVSRVNGYVVSKHFENGGYVRQGDVLYVIEPGNYADAVRQAQAQLATAQSNYDYNTRNYTAMKKALESNAVSQMEVAQAKSNMENSLASVQNARAALQSAQTTLGYCTIRAPFSGHISDGPYREGSYVAGEGSPVTLSQLYDDTSVNINFAIDDAELLRILTDTQGARKLDLAHLPVTFADTIAGTYTADLSYMAPNVTTGTGSLKAYAKIMNPKGILRAGMYGVAKLPTGTLPHAMIVQDAAISSDQQGKFMYIVNDQNVVVYTPVKVGDLVDGTHRVILSGVRPGQKYVNKALLKVRDGMKVKPISDAAPATAQTATSK